MCWLTLEFFDLLLILPSLLHKTAHVLPHLQNETQALVQRINHGLQTASTTTILVSQSVSRHTWHAN